ncbi:MAG TPA: hypothetical protein VMO24_05940, partial [Woeseiaceae bacterium]|nr:hypothetical protein [Woeseiaceae bacterium]
MRIGRVGTDDGLDDEPVLADPVEKAGESAIFEVRVPVAGNDVRALLLEIAKIGLGQGPTHERKVVDQDGARAIDTFQYVHESVDILRIVPGRPDVHGVKDVPVDVRRAPRY